MADNRQCSDGSLGRELSGRHFFIGRLSRIFERAVAAARTTLTSAGKDVSRFEGFTWHGLRHTRASRLVIGWRRPSYAPGTRRLAEHSGWFSDTATWPRVIYVRPSSPNFDGTSTPCGLPPMLMS